MSCIFWSNNNYILVFKNRTFDLSYYQYIALLQPYLSNTFSKEHQVKNVFLILILTSISFGKMAIAVMELQGTGLSEDNLAGLSNRLRTELFKTGEFTVIERSQMSLILKEQGFQQSGCISSECAVEVGQLVGAEKIVVGDVDKIGNIFVTDIRLVDVATGKIEQIATTDCEECSISEVLRSSIFTTAQTLAGTSTNLSQSDIPKLSPNTSSSSGKCAIRIQTERNNIISIDGDSIGTGTQLIDNLHSGEHVITSENRVMGLTSSKTVIAIPNETRRYLISHRYPFLQISFLKTVTKIESSSNYVDFEGKVSSTGISLMAGYVVSPNQFALSLDISHADEYSIEATTRNEKKDIRLSEQTLFGGGFSYERELVQQKHFRLSLGGTLGGWVYSRQSDDRTEEGDVVIKYKHNYGPSLSIRSGKKNLWGAFQYRFLLGDYEEQKNTMGFGHCFSFGIFVPIVPLNDE